MKSMAETTLKIRYYITGTETTAKYWIGGSFLSEKNEAGMYVD